MRILIGHNQYQNFGGEDAAALTEMKLLQDKGHDVHLYSRTNAELKNFSIGEKSRFMWYLAWSEQSYQELRKIIREFKPAIAHFHNIYFMMSPAVYYACKDEGVPVVQSLHNFRPLCVNGLFYRDNHVCEDCLNGSLFNGIRHKCYQESYLISALVARMLKAHRKMGTWKNMINAYITATEFTRQKYISAGFAAEKIFIKPNLFYPAPHGTSQDKGYGLYMGRLSEEKGLDMLVKAWKDIDQLPLKIAGDGPQRQYLSGYIQNNKIKNIELLGHVVQDQQQYKALMQGAKFIIVPSVCYENFPRIVAEAMAYGIPVIASRLGSLKEIIQHEVDGFLFEAGNPHDLAEKVSQCLHTSRYNEMKKHALMKYAEKYSAEVNYETLLNIYRKVQR